MKRAAFYLVGTVISIQLLIMAGVLVGCFVRSSELEGSPGERCSGDKVSELMTFITAQSFALYAAEK